MNLKRKTVEVTIDEVVYDLVLDFESAIDFEDIYGKSVFEGIRKISQEQNIKALACLIACCLKDENGAVGMDFVKKLDLMEYLELFIEKLGDLMANSIEEEKDEEVQKKTVKNKTKK